MNVYRRHLRIPIPAIVVIAWLMFSGWFLWQYFYGSWGDKLNNLASGVAASALIAALQLMWSWYENHHFETLKQLQVRNILLTRDNALYYGKLIKDSKQNISLVGVTAKRFLEDFANEKHPDPKNRVLLDALGRGVKVRLLVADKSHLGTSQESLSKFDVAAERMASLKKQFPGLFFFAYYNHQPIHSIVQIDDECILGPCFPELDSKLTPAIHISASSGFSTQYLEFMKKEWDRYSAKAP